MFVWVVMAPGIDSRNSTMRKCLKNAFLELQRLEVRAVPTIYTVNALSDNNSGSGTSGDLRYCLGQANADKLSSDTIVFDNVVFATPQTIELSMGELFIQGSTSIQGPGADRLTIDGEGASRVFRIDNGSTSHTDVTIVGMRITNGSAVYGAAIWNIDEYLTLDSVRIDNNFGQFRSGGIQAGPTKLVVLNSTISGNTTSGTGPGGGIYITGGTATYLVIQNSTISTNTAGGTGKGGGIYVRDPGSTIKIENSTIAQNQSIGNGGGIFVSGLSTPLTNFKIESSIIGGNIAVTGVGADIYGPTVTATNCFIGVGDSGFTLNKQGTTIAGTKNSPADPHLGPLQNNGGPVPTHMPDAASTVRDLGSNPGGLLYDQRGDGFPRMLQGGVDIGAVESMSNNPTATMKGIDPIWQPGTTPNTIEVTYKDATAVDWTTIDTSDIQILDPNSMPLSLTGVSVDLKSNGSPRVATYTFTVPGGGWELADNGKYTINMLADQVKNASGIAVPASKLGEFSVSFGKSFVVTNTADSGAGSLRQAILDANASTSFGADSITFSGVAGTITLASDLFITDAVEIQGPGATTLAITRSGNNGHIIQTAKDDLNGVSTTLTISGLTLRDANSTFASSASGAAINSEGTLTIRDCVFSGNGSTNPNSSGGGAIDHTGTFLAERTTFQNNHIYGLGGALSASGNVTIRDCTFTGNQELGSFSSFPHAQGSAMSVGGTVLIEGCTINNNSGHNARTWGTVAVGGDVVIRNTTITNNFANSGGGVYVAYGTTTLQNCTITGNAAYDGPTYTGYGGGIDGSGGTVILQSTIVSGNNDADAPDIATFSGTLQADHSAIGSLTGITTFIDNGNNLAPGTPLGLGSLSNNGGLTKTIPISVGSPCINAGSNPAGVSNDQRGTGFYRVIAKSADIGAFEYQNLPAVISSVQVNDGSPQRSLVTSLKVTFDRPVSVSANSFQLVRQSDGSPVSLSASVLGSSVTLTFTGGPVEFGSLADGRYTLTAFAGLINGGSFDGNGDTAAGDDYVLTGTPGNGLFRLFGDADGDGHVNNNDFTIFRTAFGLGASVFDFNNDGQTNSNDFAEFRKRFGLMLP
jgi:hypothetical protein